MEDVTLQEGEEEALEAMAAGLAMIRAGVQDPGIARLQALQALADSMLAPFGGAVVCSVGVPKRIQVAGTVPGDMPLPRG